MHCPHCAFDNPLTTRFCSQCGGVLVEDAAPIARRRLPRMRQGVRRESPPPGVSAARRARRVEWAVAGIVVAATIVTYLAYPARTSAIVVSPAMFVPLPVSSSPRARPFTDHEGAYRTFDPLPGLAFPSPTDEAVDGRSPAKAVGSRDGHVGPDRDPARKPGRREPVAVPSPLPAPEPVAAPVEPARVEPPAPPPPRAPDRWQQMEERLGRCTDGTFFDRVLCDQKVRIAFCEGHWGAASQCPSGRVADYGQ